MCGITFPFSNISLLCLSLISQYFLQFHSRGCVVELCVYFVNNSEFKGGGTVMRPLELLTIIPIAKWTENCVCRLLFFFKLINICCQWIFFFYYNYDYKEDYKIKRHHWEVQCHTKKKSDTTHFYLMANTNLHNDLCHLY